MKNAVVSLVALLVALLVGPAVEQKPAKTRGNIATKIVAYKSCFYRATDLKCAFILGSPLPVMLRVLVGFICTMYSVLAFSQAFTQPETGKTVDENF